MHIEFNLTEDDLIDFNLYHMAHSPAEQRSLLVTRTLTALLTALLAYSVIYILSHATDWFGLVIILVVSVAAFLSYPYLLRRTAISHMHKLFQEGDNSAVFGPERMTFSPDGILEVDGVGERQYNWSAVQRVAGNGRQIFLYVSSTKALVIPARAFASDAMKQEFLQLVNAYAKKG